MSADATARTTNATSTAGANHLGMDELSRQLIRHRGIEAVLWSMPAISDVFFRESLFRDYGMRPGDVMVMSKPLKARHEILTPNNQVNYAVGAFDLADGSLVIDIPPSSSDYAVIGEICDNWQAPVTMVGLEGPDAGRGGKYLLIPPGSDEEAPAGYHAIRMQGFRGTLVYRPVVVGKGTMEGAVALARQTRTYRLRDAAAPRETLIVDGWDRPWRSLPVYDISWFKHLSAFIDAEPVRERDKVMIGMLASLGIEKGKPFEPDASMVTLLEMAVKDAYRIMQDGWETPGKALTAWWPTRQWTMVNPALFGRMGEAWSFETTEAVWTYDRAIAPFFWANYLPKELGGQQLYLMNMRDSAGERLSGTSSYRIRIPSDVPVDKFWSLIVYSQKTKGFIPNQADRVGLDSYDKTLRKNDDGTTDIYLGHEPPPAGYENNWLPSAGEDFFLIFRFYGPHKSVYERTWTAPDVERMQ